MNIAATGRLALRRFVSFFLELRTLVALTATVFAVAAVVAASTPVTDADVWWVAAAGRTMLARGAVLRVNAFSFVEPDHPWIMHEALFGPAYAMLAGSLGPAGFNLVALVALTIALALIAGATVGRARRVDAGLTMALAAVALFGSRLMTARPTGVALVFPLGLVVLAFRPTFSVLAALAAVAIEVVWTNAHGSFPLGLALLALAAVESATDRPRRIAALIAATVGTVANPYGLALHGLVWKYARAEDDIFREIGLHVREFAPLTHASATATGADVIAYVLVAVLVLGALTKAAHRMRAMFCLVLVAASLRQARHFEMAGLLSCVLLVRYVDDVFAARFPPVRSVRVRAIGAMLVLPAFAIGAAAFGVALRLREPDDWVAEGSSFLELVRALPDGARTYVPFPEASLVLWYAAPRGVRVFYDSRNDCYSAATSQTFFGIETGALPGDRAIAALDESGTTAVLVPAVHPLSSRLDRNWHPSGERGPWRLYVRDRPPRPTATPSL